MTEPRQATPDYDPDGGMVPLSAWRKSPTLFQLQQAEEGYRLVADEAENLRQHRNQMICKALADGITHSQIAYTTGLSRGRISQIAKG